MSRQTFVAEVYSYVFILLVYITMFIFGDIIYDFQNKVILDIQSYFNSKYVKIDSLNSDFVKYIGKFLYYIDYHAY